MKCPNCSHDSKSILLKCSSCGEIYQRQTIEEFEHVNYLLEWIDEQREVLGDSLARKLIESVQARRTALLTSLLPEKFWSQVDDPGAPTIKELDADTFVLAQMALKRLPLWVSEDRISVASAGSLRQHLSSTIFSMPPGISAPPQSEAKKISIREESQGMKQLIDTWVSANLISESEASAIMSYYPTLADRVSVDRPVVPEHRVGKAATLVFLTEEKKKLLAVQNAVRTHISKWVAGSKLNYIVGITLKDNLARSMQAIHPEAMTPEILTVLSEVRESEAIHYFLSRLDEWTADKLLTQDEGNILREYVEGLVVHKTADVISKEIELEPVVPAVMPAGEEANALKPVEQVVASQVAVRVEPEAPAKLQEPPPPREPLIEWDKVWGKVVEAAVSGLLLRWLRYLGAFLFVISIAIVVVNFWNEIPQWGQVAIIFFVPGAFYAGGWLLRTRLGVVQTGAVLMGVGQILLAIDFAAIYQFGGLDLDPRLYWLITSVICTVIYLATVFFVVQAEFFGYIGLVGIGSTAAAAVAAVTVSLEWPVVAAAGVAVISVEAGYRLSKRSEKWGEIAEAGLRFPQFIIPMILLLLLLLPTPQILWAQAAGFALATAAAGLLAIRLGNALFTHASVWFAALTAIMLLRSFQSDLSWYPAAAGGLSLIYGSIVPLIKRGSEELRLRRKRHLLPFEMGAAVTAAAAIVIGLVLANFERLPGVINLSFAVFVLVVHAVIQRRPLYMPAAAVLLYVPLSLASLEWMANVSQKAIWLVGIWAIVSIGYLGVAAVLRRQTAYICWLTLTAQMMTVLSLIILIGISVIDSSLIMRPASFVLGSACLFYALSALLHHNSKHPALSDWVPSVLPDPLRKGVFVWAAAILVPIWLALTWQTTIIEPAWLAVGLAVLGLVYVGVGQSLGRYEAAYRSPFRYLPYFLAVAGLAPAWGESLPLMTALYVIVIVFALFAVQDNSVTDTTLAALVFLWPLTLAIDLLGLAEHVYAVGFIALAGIVYMPLAEWLVRKIPDDFHHYPLRGIAYALSVVAIVLSIPSILALEIATVPWVSVLVPLAAAVLYGYSAFRVHAGFIWAAVAVLPLAFWQTLKMLNVLPDWYAAAWVGFGTAYLVAGILVKRLADRTGGKRWHELLRVPLNAGAWALAAFGLALTASFSISGLLYGTLVVQPTAFAAPVTAQWLTAAFVVIAAVFYRSRLPLFLEPWLTFLPATLMLVGYGEKWFGRFVELGEFAILWAGWGVLHVLIAGVLDRIAGIRGSKQGVAAGIYLGGYLLLLLAVLWSLGSEVPFLWAFGLLILVSIGSAALVHTGRHLAWGEFRSLFVTSEREGRIRPAIDSIFIWVAAWSLPVWMFVFLRHLPLLPGYEYLGFAGTAVGLLVAAVVLGRMEQIYALPLYLSSQVFTAVTWLLSLPFSGLTLLDGPRIGQDEPAAAVAILMQAVPVVYYFLFAFLFRRKVWGYVFSFAAAALVVLPYTLYLRVFALPLTGSMIRAVDFSVAWVVLGGALLVAAAYIERSRDAPGRSGKFRFDAFSAHGPYLAGYGLASFALMWAYAHWRPATTDVFILALGAWTLLMSASAWLVHAGRHHSWDDLVRLIFERFERLQARVLRSAFLWLAAFSLPVWLTVSLWWLDVEPSFGFLGYTGSALAFLGYAGRVKQVERVYAWPFLAAGQCYNLVAIAYTLPETWSALNWQGPAVLASGTSLSLIGSIVVLAFTTGYYAASSAYFRNYRWIARIFSYAAALLIWIPVTAGTILLYFGEMNYSIAYAWVILSGVLLAVGFGLDALERRRVGALRVGFAHGAYFAGYLGLVLTVLWTWPDRIVWLYVSGAALLPALVSQWAVHTKRHETWTDVTGFLFTWMGDSLREGMRSGFLWATAVLFPIWLTTLLAYQDVLLAWRGLALALTAPVYLSIGLALRRVDAVYAWPLFVTGYLLTAIGAMVSFDDLLLATYVLGLNAVVFAASAIIFRQPIWLYLVTFLVPVIGLMALQYDQDALPPAWVTGFFLTLAYLYMGIGQFFDRQSEEGPGIHAFAMPFYGPGFLLSALALATASGDRDLALAAYMAGVVLYAFSAWRFREPVFLYPAVWLAAVPYYLGMTYTRLDPVWYGVGWLPLIAVAFLLGRWVFYRRGDRVSLLHPSMPFYILAYALSLSMLLIGRGETLVLAVSLAAAGVLYLVSAWVFRHATWLYPGLLAGHLALAVFTQVEPGRFPANILAVLFLPVTAFVTITGVVIWKNRARPEARDWKSVSSGWAGPFILFGVLDLVVWQIVGAFGRDTGLVVAGGHAVIVAVVAVLRLSRPAVWTSLGFLILALVLRLLSLDFQLSLTGALLAGTGFFGYLTGRSLAELAGRISQRKSGIKPHPALAIWSGPVMNLGIGLNLVGLAAGAVFVFEETTLVAVSLVFAGSLGLAEAYRLRRYLLGYASVAVLEFAYMLLVLRAEITQLQIYAIPAGLYLVGVAYFERRRGRFSFATLLESLGLIAMLLTSFGQSLNPVGGFWYFLLLLIESILIIAWAAQQQRKIPLLIGSAGMLANVIGQIIIVFLGGETLERWLIFGGVGLLILLAAIYAERWIIPRAQELRERLEAWS